jgi:hypothetical protein
MRDYTYFIYVTYVGLFRAKAVNAGVQVLLRQRGRISEIRRGKDPVFGLNPNVCV